MTYSAAILRWIFLSDTNLMKTNNIQAALAAATGGGWRVFLWRPRSVSLHAIVSLFFLGFAETQTRHFATNSIQSRQRKEKKERKKIKNNTNFRRI